MKKLVAAIVGLSIAATLSMTSGLAEAGAPVDAWSCRNEQFEIACTGGRCEASESFTPMDVSIAETGMMSICAYSGCWEGLADQTSRSDRFLYVSSSRLRFSTSPAADQESFAVQLDRKTRIATLIGAGFAHPMTCTPTLP